MTIKRLVICLLFLSTGAVQAQTSNYGATVNGAGITRAKIQAQVDNAINERGLNYGRITSPDQFKQLQREVIERLITQELLWQEAERRQRIATPDEVEQMLAQVKRNFDSEQAFLFKLEAAGFTLETYREDLKRQLSVRHMIVEDIAGNVTVGEQEIEQFYAANQDKMQRPEEIRARHVLINVPADADEATRATARQRIEKILADARDGADFATLAREHSEGPSAPRGGDLGFFGRGMMVPGFEAAAFALQPGEISDVVSTRFGYHIIKLEERRDGALASLDEVSGQIRTHLQQQRVQEALASLVQTLRAKGDIEILLPI